MRVTCICCICFEVYVVALNLRKSLHSVNGIVVLCVGYTPAWDQRSL